MDCFAKYLTVGFWLILNLVRFVRTCHLWCFSFIYVAVRTDPGRMQLREERGHLTCNSTFQSNIGMMSQRQEPKKLLTCIVKSRRKLMHSCLLVLSWISPLSHIQDPLPR